MAAMAVQMQLARTSPPPISSIASLSSWPAKYSSSVAGDLHRSSGSVDMNNKKKKGKGVGVRVTRVRSSLEMAGPVAGPVVGQVTEVNKDTFWPLVEAAAAEDKPVVLDMYTQWCGPCKVMAPKYQELSQKYTDVVFFKLDCNKENKELAKELGIRVVPTFKILKDSKVVTEVTGAKFDNLVAAIESVRSSLKEK
ncbi:hypothetical protein LguiA_022059 [Lonicera macranthoides]